MSIRYTLQYHASLWIVCRDETFHWNRLLIPKGWWRASRRWPLERRPKGSKASGIWSNCTSGCSNSRILQPPRGLRRLTSFGTVRRKNSLSKIETCAKFDTRQIGVTKALINWKPQPHTAPALTAFAKWGLSYPNKALRVELEKFCMISKLVFLLSTRSIFCIDISKESVQKFNAEIRF